MRGVFIPISQMRKYSSDIKKLEKVTQPLSAKHRTGSVLATTASTPEAPACSLSNIYTDVRSNIYTVSLANGLSRGSIHSLETPRTWAQAGKLPCPPQPLHFSVRVETGGLRKLIKEALSTVFTI